MKKKIHLGYDLSWTHLDGRWRSTGSWSHVNFPDIRIYEEIAQIAECGLLDFIFFGDGTGIPNTWEGSIEREVRDLKIAVTGNFALVHGYYRLGGTPKSAGRPISFWMRATVALQCERNGWQTVHEHVSVPFYMDGSLRPAFDLQP